MVGIVSAEFPALSIDIDATTMSTMELSSHTSLSPNHPIHAERHVRIICVGAGASGLLFAYKLQRSFSNFSLVVYEKNEEVGGTWWENKYPG